MKTILGSVQRRRHFSVTMIMSLSYCTVERRLLVILPHSTSGVRGPHTQYTLEVCGSVQAARHSFPPTETTCWPVRNSDCAQIVPQSIKALGQTDVFKTRAGAEPVPVPVGTIRGR